MKLLFAHDHIFLRAADGTYYSDGKFPYAVWERYLKHFACVTVASRVQESDSQSLRSYNVASGANVSFVHVPSHSNLRSLLGLQRSVALERAVRCADAIVARLPSEIGLAAINFARRFKKPWAVEVVGCQWDALWNYGRFSARLYAPVATHRMRRAVRRAPFALYVTDRFLQQRYPSPHACTASCSNVEIPSVDPLVGAVRKQRPAGDPFVLGLIGSLKGEHKGIHIAIRALAELKGTHERVLLRILGRGDTAPWLALASDLGVRERVEFCGTLPAGPAVFRWLDQLDLYIQPSFQEGLPRALIEAMSRAIPALGSTAGGIPDLLASEAIHVRGNHRQLASQIARAIEDESWRLEQGQRNLSVAARYQKNVLDNVRDSFWSEFLSFARNQSTSPLHTR